MAGTDRTRDPVLGGPAIILVRPQLGENIGAVARAMLNFGLTDMRLVAPRDGWPNPDAQATAAGAADILENAAVFDHLEDAIGDMHRIFATTARRRELIKPEVTPRRAASEMRREMADNHACAILFGAERSGLSNDEIAVSDRIVVFPANPAFASLNLAQAVLIMAYEWFITAEPLPELTLSGEEIAPVKKSDLLRLFEHLEEELDARGFFRPAERKSHMVRSLRVMLTRANLFDQDVRTLRGVIKALTRQKGSGK